MSLSCLIKQSMQKLLKSYGKTRSPNDESNVVRMGTFHSICAFLAAIGKRFGDGGLANILLESEVVGSGSIAAILEGRHYNRAIRIHKVKHNTIMINKTYVYI